MWYEEELTLSCSLALDRIYSSKHDRAQNKASLCEADISLIMFQLFRNSTAVVSPFMACLTSSLGSQYSFLGPHHIFLDETFHPLNTNSMFADYCHITKILFQLQGLEETCFHLLMMVRSNKELLRQD